MWPGSLGETESEDIEMALVQISDMEKYVAWCEENGYNPAERGSRKAYDAAHKPGVTGRKNSARDAVLVAIGKLPDGTELFKRTTCAFRDRHAAADLLRWKMQTEDECESVRFIVGSDLDDPSVSE